MAFYDYPYNPTLYTNQAAAVDLHLGRYSLKCHTHYDVDHYKHANMLRLIKTWKVLIATYYRSPGPMLFPLEDPLLSNIWPLAQRRRRRILLR